MLEIRALTPDDWELTRRLRLTALADAPQAFLSTLAEAEQRTEAEWRDWPGGDATAFGAWLDGEAVGLACGDCDADDTCHLFAMWVAPGARGHRIAGALIDAISAWALGRGGRRVRLEFAAGNASARRAYLHQGFVVVDEEPQGPGGGVMVRELVDSDIRR